MESYCKECNKREEGVSRIVYMALCNGRMTPNPENLLNYFIIGKVISV